MRLSASEMPILLMVFNAEVERRIEIHAFSSGMKNFFVIKLGLKRRFVFLFEKETLFPLIACLPVN